MFQVFTAIARKRRANKKTCRRMAIACRLPAICQMVIANNEREEAAKLAGSKVHLN